MSDALSVTVCLCFFEVWIVTRHSEILSSDTMPAAKKTATKKRTSKARAASGFSNRYGARAYPSQTLYAKQSQGRTMIFKRSSPTTDLIVASDAFGAVGLAVKFTLADLPNYTEFTSLFESYRIYKIVARWIPLNGESGWNGSSSSANLNAGLLVSAVDYNDATVETAAQLQEKRMSEIWNAYKEHYVTIYPRVAVPVYAGVTTFGYGDSQRLWLSTNNAAIEHYGHKLSAAAMPASTNLGRIQYTYYIECRNYH